MSAPHRYVQVQQVPSKAPVPGAPGSPPRARGRCSCAALAAVAAAGAVLLVRALIPAGEAEQHAPSRGPPAPTTLVLFPGAAAAVQLPSRPGSKAALLAMVEAHQAAGGRRAAGLQVRDMLGGGLRDIADDAAVRALRDDRDLVVVSFGAPNAPRSSWLLGRADSGRGGAPAPTPARGPKGGCDTCGQCPRLPGAWAPISLTRSCEDNDEGIVRHSAKWDLPSLDSCLSACTADPECRAVDWYCETKWCNLHSEVCSRPAAAHQGASAYKLTSRKGTNTDACPETPRPYHVMVTASEKVYEQWAVRVTYYWYRKVRAADPCGEMGAFTRLLHGEPDELMGEIPTVVVDRIPNDYGFVVLNRPNAFAQWLRRLDQGRIKIAEEYLLLMEPDQFFLKPLPNIAPAGFQFSYMNAPKGSPQFDAALPHLPSGKTPSDIPASGPSPTLLHLSDWRKLTPQWLRRSVAMQRDRKAQRAYTWVLEMWGFSIATLDAGVHLAVLDRFQTEPCTVQWCQPHLHKDERVWVRRRGQGPFLLHVTFAQNFDLEGGWWDEAINGTTAPWSFNKRKYSLGYPPTGLTGPPRAANHTGAGLIVEMVNEASAALSGWGKRGTAHGPDTCAGSEGKAWAAKCKAARPTRHLERLRVGDAAHARAAVAAASAPTSVRQPKR